MSRPRLIAMLASLDYEANQHAEHVKIARILAASNIMDLPPTVEMPLAHQWMGGPDRVYLSVSIDYRYQADGGYDSDVNPDTLPWAERVKPIGQVLRACHAHGITRRVDDYGTVTYRAEGTLSDDYGREYTCQLTVSVPHGGLQPTCRVETETYTETVTRTRVKVTCDDARQEAVA